MKPKEQMYQCKCPFQNPSNGTKFNNMPGMLETLFIRIYHFLQRHVVQGGGLQSCNPITKLAANFFYYTDWIMCIFDANYYVKRQAIFGPNFVSVLAVVVSKYDASSKAVDSFDARLLTIPQRRGFILGPTIMDPTRQYYSQRDNHALVPFFVSDPGAIMNPDLNLDQPDHTVLRSFLSQHFLGEEQIKEIIKRQTDETGRALLQDFGTSVKGISDKDQIWSSLMDFLPRFLCYTMFDVPIDLIPLDDIVTAHTSAAFALFHVKLPSCLYKKLKPKIIRSARERVTDALLEHSRVLKDVPDGPDGLTRNDLMEMLHMVFGIAAFGGTSALTMSCLTQKMPEGYAAEVMRDEDNVKLRNAVLECSRLNAPVTSAHCIVDDDEGFTTQIGRKTIKFPNGTVLCTGIILANIDEKRYPNPFVFDPENRDFSNLTSFNSVGDSTNPSAPRICPGREVALSTVMLMMKAKSEAESAENFADYGALW